MNSSYLLPAIFFTLIFTALTFAISIHTQWQTECIADRADTGMVNHTGTDRGMPIWYYSSDVSSDKDCVTIGITDAKILQSVHTVKTTTFKPLAFIADLAIWAAVGYVGAWLINSFNGRRT